MGCILLLSYDESDKKSVALKRTMDTVQEDTNAKKENIKNNEREVKKLDKEIKEMNKKLDEVCYLPKETLGSYSYE